MRIINGKNNRNCKKSGGANVNVAESRHQ